MHLCREKGLEMSIVSVIIPVHNTADYLRKCVESVRDQSLKDIEIILVDNLSTDDSPAMCDAYAKLDSRIKVLHLPVADLSTARNAGIKEATSEYIGFIDSDDHISSTMYEEMVDALVRNQADMTYCNFCYEYPDMHTDSPYPNSGEVYLCSQREVLREMMQEKMSCSACTKLFKRELFDSFLFPEGVLYEDRAAMHQCILLCQRIAWIDKAFYFYVERQGSICHTVKPLNLYHHFLSEFARIQFIKEQALFEGKELYVELTRIINICFALFKQILSMTKVMYFREPIEDMRQKLKILLYLSKEEIEPRCYKRLRKIVYFWKPYYFFNFYFKKKDWRP